MANKKTEMKNLKLVLKELEEIKERLDRFLLLIPEEKIDEYKNSRKIVENYQKALAKFPPL